MKKLIIILLLAMPACLMAQLRSGKPVYGDIDTVKGSETVYIYFPDSTAEFKSFYSLSLEVYFQELGGTTDGTLTWEYANDSNWFSLTSVNGTFLFTENDTTTLTSGGAASCLIYGNPFNKIRAKIEGTTGDTTRLVPNYIRK